jgi:hypothetical protein
VESEIGFREVIEGEGDIGGVLRGLIKAGEVRGGGGVGGRGGGGACQGRDRQLAVEGLRDRGFESVRSTRYRSSLTAQSKADHGPQADFPVPIRPAEWARPHCSTSGNATLGTASLGIAVE